MKYSTFIKWNVLGGIVWGAGLTLLGYLLGQIAVIRDNVDMIFIAIVLVSIIPIALEVVKRSRGRSRKHRPRAADGCRGSRVGLDDLAEDSPHGTDTRISVHPGVPEQPHIEARQLQR